MYIRIRYSDKVAILSALKDARQHIQNTIDWDGGVSNDCMTWKKQVANIDASIAILDKTS